MQTSINAIRFLGMDAINQAKSGHPGIVLGAAPAMYTLFTRHLRVTPNQSKRFNRDRFVLAAGHGSALLYSTLHLAGYKISVEDLQQFRQLGSVTPGHPELHTDGVDATSGPLGQGIAMTVGMAIAESYLATTFNKPDFNIIDHYSYVLCGDGDLQEGVTQEAMSLAGHLGLGKLIVLYDSNDIQLDGPVSWANSEDVQAKYEAMNWQYIKIDDANDVQAIHAAIEQAKGDTGRPSLIEIKSIIGYGASNQGTQSAHGAPIGVDETTAMRERMGYSYPEFTAPDEAYTDFSQHLKDRGDAAYRAWTELLVSYTEKCPELAAQLEEIMTGTVKFDFATLLPQAPLGTAEASRVSGGRALTSLSEAHVAVLGGSADLSCSTKAKGIGGNFSKENRLARNICYGVREHAMAAIVNGLVLHGLKGFSGGFFVFSDYLKPSVRMAALMHLPSTFIFTHDSIAVGEDGPTHEPIEQLSMFRTMPNCNVTRPADANETNYAYRFAMEATETPSVIVLTRQSIQVKKETTYEQFKKGAYVISDAEDFEGILIATGSEVGLALDTQALLAQEGIKVRVVSMPCMELFKGQSDEYRESVLPVACTKRLAIEMGSPDLWYQFADTIKGMTSFGVSAKGKDAIVHFGFTPEGIVELYRGI